MKTLLKVLFKQLVIFSRIYSISSSYDYTKEIEGSQNGIIVDILLTVVEYQVVGPWETLGKTGHCSGYLANLEIGSDVSMYFQTSRDMHLPEPLAGIDGFSVIDQRPLILGTNL